MDQYGHLLSRYLKVINRRKHYVIAIFLLILIASVASAYNMKKTYKSTATLLMATQIPKDIIQTIGSTYADTQITSVAQRVLTSTNALGIIRKNNLYKINDEPLPETVAISLFKNSIQVNLAGAHIGGMNDTGSTTEIAFTISFSYLDPVITKDIVDQLAALFIAQNDLGRSQQATRTAAFLTDESQKLESEIRKLDGKISDYKKINVDSLPDQMQGNISLLDKKESEIRDIDQRIQATQEKNSFLLIEINKLKALSDNDVYGFKDKSTNPRAEKLYSLQNRYIELSTKYLPSHPDLVRIKKQIEDLEHDTATNSFDEADQELNEPLTDRPIAERLRNQRQTQDERVQKQSKTQSIYERESRQATPAIASLEAQYRTSEMELRSLENKKTSLQAEIARLNQRILAAPEVEKGYLELIRDRDGTLSKYNQLKEKLLDAKLLQTLEAEQHGQTMTIIEKPTIPENPESGSRKKVVIIGLALGLLSGVGAAFAIEYLDPGVRGVNKVFEITGLMPIVMVPYIELPSEVENRLVNRRLLNKALIIMVIIILIVIAIGVFVLRQNYFFDSKIQ